MTSPTAEEVLGLYQRAQGKQGTNDDYLAFHRALRQWQSAQGPVTREWFVERFGGVRFTCARGDISFWAAYGMVELLVHNDEETVIQLADPTRSDIETLVRLLGGEK